MKHLDSNKGFTLVELLVSMSVFLVVLGLATGVFVRTFKTQRIVTQLSDSMTNVTLAIEQIARDARTGLNFEPSGDLEVDVLRFTTGNARRVAYTQINNRIGRCQGACLTIDEDNFEPITSPEVEIVDMSFIINSEDFHPPRITILTTVMPNEITEVFLQTTVSSRILD